MWSIPWAPLLKLVLVTQELGESNTGHKGKEYRGGMREKDERVQEEILHIDKMEEGNNSGS